MHENSNSSERFLMALQKALRDLSNGTPLLTGSTCLLNALGYESEKTLDIGGIGEFVSSSKTDADSNLTRRLELFQEKCSNIEIIFQITDEEITNKFIKQNSSTGSGFDEGRIKSFIFVAAEMVASSYTRTDLAYSTRTINRYFRNIPIIVIFRHGNSLTLSVTHRRPSKKKGENNRDVLTKVTLIKDINLKSPHRAHLDILIKLSFYSAVQDGIQNFDQLHESWEKTLNTEALSKRFYYELYRWYERAVTECRLSNVDREDDSLKSNIIRLITRLLFTWFLKEKSLVPEKLFTEEFAKKMVIDHGHNNSNYYHAVLQNLFFATLNTDIDKRKQGGANQPQYANSGTSHFLFKNQLKQPDQFAQYMEKVPFVNGGLFDSLPSDAFTEDKPTPNEPHVPAWLFFDEKKGIFSLFERYKFTVEESTPIDAEVALDPELLGMVFENLLAAQDPETGQSERKTSGSFYTPRPIVDYMVRQALTETLVKHVGPEDDESRNWLRERIEYLLDHNDAMDDAHELFSSEEETKCIIKAISNLKTLDPAVGSGAFSMGILQTLMLALSRLDPQNSFLVNVFLELEGRRDNESNNIFSQIKWRQKLFLIQNAIYGIDIQPIACQIAKLRFFISLIIEQKPNPNLPNMGIKPLPNLENHLIAADSLLKNDISSTDQLIIQSTDTWKEEQKELSEIREKYFLECDPKKKHDLVLKDENLRKTMLTDIENAHKQKIAALKGRLERDLNDIPNPSDREDYRKKCQIKIDKEKKRFEGLIRFAKSFAEWDPYDQNGTAGWFNAKYMFGVSDGFDIVIGNPPYIQLQKNRGYLGKRYSDSFYKTFVSSGDIYQLFYERGCELLNENTGVLAYITSNSWLHANYGKKLRQFLYKYHKPLRLIDMGSEVFDDATVDTAVLLLENKCTNKDMKKLDEKCPAIDMQGSSTFKIPDRIKDWGVLRLNNEAPWIILASSIEEDILAKIEEFGTPLRDNTGISIYYGIKTGCNNAFIVDQITRDTLIDADPSSAEILKPIIRGRDIAPYRANWAGKWLIDAHNGYKAGKKIVPTVNINNYPAIKKHLDRFYPQLKKRKDKGITPYNLRSCAYHENFRQDKVIWSDIGGQGKFSYDDSGLYINNTAYMMVGKHMKYMCAFLNSSPAYWYMLKTSNTLGMGYRWFKIFVESIPIVLPSEIDKFYLSNLVDEASSIISNKKRGLDLLEQEIDAKVYDMYGLSENEIKIIRKTTNAWLCLKSTFAQIQSGHKF